MPLKLKPLGRGSFVPAVGVGGCPCLFDLLTYVKVTLPNCSRISEGGALVHSTLRKLRCRVGTKFDVNNATPFPLPIRVHSVSNCGPALTVDVKKRMAG